MTAPSASTTASIARSDLRPPSVRDAVAAVLVGGWGIFLVGFHSAGSWAASLAMVLVGLPLLLCRSRPIIALWLVAAAIWANGLAFGMYIRCSAELPAFGYAVFYAVRSCRTRLHRVVIVACCVVYLAGENASDPIMSWDGGLGLAIALVLAMALAGELVRRRDLEAQRLQEEIVALHTRREETARVAAEAERLRIRTGLVAEVESRLAAIRTRVLSTQTVLTASTSTESTIAGHGAASGFIDIEDLGRDTLATMRDSLGALRGNGATGVGTLPVLADLTVLLGRLERPAVLRLEGEARPLGSALELTAYRIVELVLTALDPTRASVGVVLNYGSRELELRLHGQAAPGGSGDIAAGLRAAGMRASAVGGSLSYRVVHGLLTASSRLPVEPAGP